MSTTDLSKKPAEIRFSKLVCPGRLKLSNAEQALEHERIQQRYDRLQAWRNKMQSSIRSYYKWIKHTQYTFPFMVCSLLHRINSIPLTLYPMP